MSIPIEQVSDAYYKHGNYGDKGLLYGFSFMAGYILGSAGLSSRSHFRDPYTNKINTDKVVLYMAGSTVFGGLFGSLIPKWKPIVLQKNNVSIQINPKIIIENQTNWIGTRIYTNF